MQRAPAESTAHPHLASDPSRREALALVARASIGAATLGAAIGSGLLAGCAGREPAPDANFVRLDGSTGSIAGLRGKVLLVNFWATSCASCVAEMPQLVQTFQRFSPRGYETLAVAMSYDPPAYVSNFAQRRALPFSVAIDNTGAISKAFGDIRLTPTSFLIDKRGQIVKRYVGPPDFDDFNKLVDKLLAEA